MKFVWLLFIFHPYALSCQRTFYLEKHQPLKNEYEVQNRDRQSNEKPTEVYEKQKQDPQSLKNQSHVIKTEVKFIPLEMDPASLEALAADPLKKKLVVSQEGTSSLLMSGDTIVFSEGLSPSMLSNLGNPKSANPLLRRERDTVNTGLDRERNLQQRTMLRTGELYKPPAK